MFKDLNVDTMKVFAHRLDLPRILTRKPELMTDAAHIIPALDFLTTTGKVMGKVTPFSGFREKVDFSKLLILLVPKEGVEPS